MLWLKQPFSFISFQQYRKNDYIGLSDETNGNQAGFSLFPEST